MCIYVAESFRHNVAISCFLRDKTSKITGYNSIWGLKGAAGSLGCIKWVQSSSILARFNSIVLSACLLSWKVANQVAGSSCSCLAVYISTYAEITHVHFLVAVAHASVAANLVTWPRVAQLWVCATDGKGNNNTCVSNSRCVCMSSCNTKLLNVHCLPKGCVVICLCLFFAVWFCWLSPLQTNPEANLNLDHSETHTMIAPAMHLTSKKEGMSAPPKLPSPNQVGHPTFI